jgi:hypothetical protein
VLTQHDVEQGSFRRTNLAGTADALMHYSFSVALRFPHLLHQFFAVLQHKTGMV